MKKLIRKVLVKAFNPLAVRLGYNSYYSPKLAAPEPDKGFLLKNFYGILKSSGFNAKHIVDIGANHGTWTREALLYFPEAHYTLLEPQYWLKDSIKDLLDSNHRIKFHGVGAGKTNGTFKFTVASRDDSSSFAYSAEDAQKEGLKQIDIPVVTLNTLLENSEIPLPDIIKIDAEGLDIEVLSGASNFFGKTEIFLVEASVVCKGFNNTVQNMINFMDERGYNLFEITDLNRPFEPRVLWLVELAFVRKGGILDTKKFI